MPGGCTVCAVLPISSTKVKQLRTSTLGYEIATSLPFRIALRRAGDLRFTVAGDVYRLRRTAYIIDQGKSTPHLNLGYVIATPLPFRVALRRAGGIRFTVAGDAYRLRRTAYAVVGCQIAIYPLGKTGVGYAAGPFCCGACQQQQLCRSCAFPAQGCGRSPLPWVAAQLL